jgi:hypothetical protein
MDEGKKNRWDWLPAQMPGVSRQLADKRRELGADWVNECWRRGVVNLEPGWFFAAEGALMVGVLGDDPAMLEVVRHGQEKGRSMVMLKEKEAPRGTA